MELLDGKYQIEQLLGQGGMGAVVITLVQFALPILVWRAAVTTEFTLQLNDDFYAETVWFQLFHGRPGELVPIFECVHHTAHIDHGVVALFEDAKGRRRIAERRKRSVRSA